MREAEIGIDFHKPMTVWGYQKLEKPRKDPSLTSFGGTLPTP